MASQGVKIQHGILKSLRITLGLSRPQAVERLRQETGLVLKEHSLYQIEVGRRNPSPKTFHGLCKVYGVMGEQKASFLSSETDRYAMSLCR